MNPFNNEKLFIAIFVIMAIVGACVTSYVQEKDFIYEFIKMSICMAGGYVIGRMLGYLTGLSTKKKYVFRLAYKGYTGIVEFDEVNQIYSGNIINAKDIITFQSETAYGLKEEFINSIEDYLEFCASRNEAPEKPFLTAEHP